MIVITYQLSHQSTPVQNRFHDLTSITSSELYNVPLEALRHERL